MDSRISKVMSSAGMVRLVLQFVIIFFLVVSLVLGDTNIQAQEDEVVPERRDRRSTRTNQVQHSNEQLRTIIEDYNSDSVDESLLRYTPTTPSPEQVNCFVEVPATRRVGGRCVMLGSSTWGCQAGIYLAFSSECQNEATTQPSTLAQTGSLGPTPAAVAGNQIRPRNSFGRRRRPSRR